MKRDLIAILPRVFGDVLSLPEGLVAHHGDDWILVLSDQPALPAWRSTLRRQRLARAATRQRYLEALISAGPVLASLPGTTLADEDAADVLLANAPTLQRFADELRGKIQYQVTITWEASRVLERFRDAPELAPLFSSGSVSSAALVAGITRLADRLRAGVAARLDAVSCALTELPRETDMIANFVVLVNQMHAPNLDATLEDIDGIWPDGFRIRQIGPSPATSFCSFEILEVDPSGLAQARKCLGLAAGASPDDIEAARSQKLRLPGAAVEEVRRAAECLTAVARLGPDAKRVHLITRWSEPGAHAAQMEAVA